MKALVTGAGGFLGGGIARALRARGDAVVSLARGHYPALEALGVQQLRADLGDPASLRAVQDEIASCDVIFHVASKTGVWGARADFFRSNVEGTAHLLALARALGLRRFVYTSSPSATFDGRDAEGATEADCPYPAHFEAPYPESKARAEQAVLAANSPDFATTALRPHLIYGPEDPHIVPRLILRRRAGRVRRIGPGTNKVGITYIDNAVQAHLLAADALRPGAPPAGRAYFLTDGPPVELWPWIDALLVGVGEQPVRGRVPLWLAVGAGQLLSAVWGAFGLAGEPPMTPFVAKEMASSHWYDLSAAAADFGYQPAVSGDEGLARTIAWFRAHPPTAHSQR